MTDISDRFLHADIRERLQLVRGRRNAAALREFVGAPAWGDYQRLAARVDDEHLAPDELPNLLFSPGVMGSLLQSTTKGGVWWIDVVRTRKHLNDLRLSDDGTSDANAEDRVSAFNVDTTYEAFLTAALQAPGIGLRYFPYDWRKLLTLSTQAFRDCVLKLHAENGGKPLHLVGHSMGGLLMRAALMEHGDELWPLIGRVVFVGTPHYGTPAIAGYLKNHLWGFNEMALLGLYLDRRTFRSLWGVIALLPAPSGIYPGTREGDEARWKVRRGEYRHPCANFDLYEAGAWHLDLSAQDEKRLQHVLDGAREFHTRMANAHAALDNEQRAKMHVIAGVGYETLFRLEWSKRFFGLWEHAKKVTERIPGDEHREGDGRVPVASACLDDVTIQYVKGVHGGLMNIKNVYEASFAYLKEGKLLLSRTPAEALSDHLAGPVANSETPILDGSTRANEEDPGFLDLGANAETAAAHREELEQKLLLNMQYARLL
jgi:pimeloyl-ACP methyl ester carboxylesterase